MTAERLAEIRAVLAADTFPGGYDLWRVAKLLRDAGRELAAEVDHLADVERLRTAPTEGEAIAAAIDGLPVSS